MLRPIVASASPSVFTPGARAPGTATPLSNDDELWGATSSYGTSPRALAAPGGAMCFEDFIVAIFAIILERASQEIRDLSQEIYDFAEQLRTQPDLDPVQEQVLTEMNIELKTKMQDRQNLFTIVLEIVKALTETANKVIESIAK